MRKLLVTGGAGFIGVNFVRYWQEAHPGDRVVVLDALTYAGNRASLAAAEEREEFRFVHGSIGDTPLVEDLLREEKLDTIVNFAAESHVDRSISGPDAFVETNIVGTHSLLRAARRVWLQGQSIPRHRFHHVSTDEVYGSLSPDDHPFTESTPFAPNSPYAASKAASDHLVRAYHHTYGLDVTTTNCSNNYGPYQFPEKLIPLMIINSLNGKPLPIYGDGQNIRDWLYVGDHCRAIDAAIERGRPGTTYNVGGNCERTNRQVVDTICAVLDDEFRRDEALADRFRDCPAARSLSCRTLVSFVADRPGHDRRYAIDASRLQRELGVEPWQTFSTGLAQTVKWFLNNPLWWRHSGHNCLPPSFAEIRTDLP